SRGRAPGSRASRPSTGPPRLHGNRLTLLGLGRHDAQDAGPKSRLDRGRVEGRGDGELPGERAVDALHPDELPRLRAGPGLPVAGYPQLAIERLEPDVLEPHAGQL